MKRKTIWEDTTDKLIDSQYRVATEYGFIGSMAEFCELMDNDKSSDDEEDSNDPTTDAFWENL